MDSIATIDKAQEEVSAVFEGPYITTSRVLAADRAASKPKPERSIKSESLEEDLDPDLEHFSDDIQYYLCCCGSFVGFGNILVFPHLIFDNGGAAFLIPYTIAQVFVVFPFFILETAWGQLIRTKLHQKFSMVLPQLWGVGLAMAILACLTIIYYVVLFPWSLSFFLDSFKNPQPWKSEDDLWNTSYFHESVLERSSGDEPVRLVPNLFLCLIASYTIIYFSVQKGLSTSSQIVYFTVPVPCFIMAILLIKGAGLEGSEVGMYYLFVPEWEKLLQFSIWEKAISQAMFQTGLVYGPMMLYATARKPEQKLIFSSMALPMIDYFLSITGAVALFSFLGYAAQEQGVEIADLTEGGIDLAFIAYPGLLTTLGLSNFWAVLFFLMLLLIGIDTLFGLIDFVTAFCWDFFDLRSRLQKPYLVLIITLVLFAFSSLLVTNRGWDFYVFLSSHVSTLPVIFILLVESYTIVIAFGFDKLDALLLNRTGEKVPRIFKISYKYFALPAITIIMIISIYRELTYYDEEESLCEVYTGRAIMSLPIFAGFLGFCKKRKGPSVDALVEKQYGATLDDLVIKMKLEKS